jgi:chromosome segregation ATPase
MEEQVTSLPRAESRASNQVGRVTFGDVKSAYEKLRAAGVQPSTRKVHEELGLRGSRTTIVKHYDVVDRAWKAAEPSNSPPLSPLVLGELARERDTLVKERTSQLSAELTDVRASLELVIEENEGFGTATAEANSRVATLQLSLAEQSGIAETLRSQSDLLSKQLEAVNSEAESARQALALANEYLRVSEERFARLEAQEGRTRNELADARREGAELREHLEVKRHECITLQAQAEAGRQLGNHLKQSAARAETLQVELEEARSRLAGSEAQRNGLAERLKDAQDALNRAEATGQQLLRKVLESSPVLHDGETK